jgi:hypothetical protein
MIAMIEKGNGGNGVLETGNLIGLLFVMRINTMSCPLRFYEMLPRHLRYLML